MKYLILFLLGSCQEIEPKQCFECIVHNQKEMRDGVFKNSDERELHCVTLSELNKIILDNYSPNTYMTCTKQQKDAN